MEYRCAAHSTCNLKYSVTKEISTVLHSGPNYDYHFVTKELKIWKKKNYVLGENAEKHITFYFT